MLIIKLKNIYTFNTLKLVYGFFFWSMWQGVENYLFYLANTY
jgi:hypothetical protein